MKRFDLICCMIIQGNKGQRSQHRNSQWNLNFMANAGRKKKIWNQKYDIPGENVNFMTEVIVEFERDVEPSQ